MRPVTNLAVLMALSLWFAPPAAAHSKNCPKDSIKAGTVCMDTYEASVWRVPDPTGANKSLVKKIRKGTIKRVTDLTNKGAMPLGVAADDYAPCTDTGDACGDIFAVSLAEVTPSSRVTWFQANRACANAGKHLPASAEWQQAVAGSPDPGGDNGVTSCNTASVPGAVAAGSRTGCVSDFGAFDMVGNLWEWTADWMPQSTAALDWGLPGDDEMGLSGASDVAEAPGALLRGGGFSSGPSAGPLTVNGSAAPTLSEPLVGFRCAR